MSQPSMIEYHQLRSYLSSQHERIQQQEKRIKAFEQLEKKYNQYIYAAAFSQAQISKIQQLQEMKKTINQQKLKITQLNKRIYIFEMQVYKDDVYTDQPLRYANEVLFTTVNELRQQLDEERARSYILAQFSTQSKLSNVEENVFRSQIEELRTEVSDFEYVKQKLTSMTQEKELVENRLKQVKRENLELNQTLLALYDASADKTKLEDYLKQNSANSEEIIQLKTNVARSERLASLKTSEAEESRFYVQKLKELQTALEQENEELKAKIFELQVANTELSQANQLNRKQNELLKSQMEVSQSQQMSQSQAEQDKQLQSEIEAKELQFLLDKAQFYNKQLAKENENLLQRNEVLEGQVDASRAKIVQNVEFATLQSQNYKLQIELVNLRQSIQERKAASPARCQKCQEYLEQLREAESELESLRQFKKNAKAYDAEAQELELSLQNVRAQLSNCVMQIEQYEAQLKGLRAQLQTLESMPGDPQSCENCKKLITQMDQMLTDFANEKQQWSETEAALKGEYDSIAQENDELRGKTQTEDEMLKKMELLEMENAVLQEKCTYLQQNASGGEANDGNESKEELCKAIKDLTEERDNLKEQLGEALEVIDEQIK